MIFCYCSFVDIYCHHSLSLVAIWLSNGRKSFWQSLTSGVEARHHSSLPDTIWWCWMSSPCGLKGPLDIHWVVLLLSGLSSVNSLSMGDQSDYLSIYVIWILGYAWLSHNSSDNTEYKSFHGSFQISLIFVPWRPFGSKSSLVKVMAWCPMAPRHDLNQCWPSYVMYIWRHQGESVSHSMMLFRIHVVF